MTNEQQTAMDDIRNTLNSRIEAVRALPTTGWVLSLPTTPAYFVEGGKTLSGLEHATVYSEPRGAWNIRNGAGERLVWRPMHKAIAFQVQSLEKAIDTLAEMLNPAAVPPVAA